MEKGIKIKGCKAPHCCELCIFFTITSLKDFWCTALDKKIQRHDYDTGFSAMRHRYKDCPIEEYEE
jgi:hypothetical protein